MSDIRPFRGYRPRPDLVELVASPPYDVLNSQEAREMARGNPHTFLRVVKPEIDLDPATDIHSQEVYDTGKANLSGMIQEGILIRDDQPCFYIYELTMGDHVQRGLMAGVSAQEYERGLIKKHEFTRPDKEDDRARHMDFLGYNTGPVMLTYHHEQQIDTIIENICGNCEPTYNFTATDSIGHTLWAVCDPEQVDQLRLAFQQVEALYIADGHHRSAASTRVKNLLKERNAAHSGSEDYNHFLAVMFPDDQLQILGYYRVAKDLNDLSVPDFLAKVREGFEVQEGVDPLPRRLHHFTMFLDGVWYGLTPRAGTFLVDHPVKGLDAAILQDNLLAPILGVQDPRTDPRIDFVGGIRGTGELERRCADDMRIAFALYPTSVGQLIAIADTGEVMPPKSTWFEPKLRSGLVVRSIKEEPPRPN